MLTEWRDHLERLAEMQQCAGVPAVGLHGGVKKKERLSRVAGLNDASPEDPVLVLATGALVGEGFDLPRLDTLVLAFPISFRGKDIQYAGRVLRSHPSKPVVTVYDYRDGLVPVLARMQVRRQRTLEGVGFVENAAGGGRACSSSCQARSALERPGRILERGGASSRLAARLQEAAGMEPHAGP